MSVSTDYSNRDLYLENQTGFSAEPESTGDVLGKDAFLTMMVAQLKNQDPLNPMDGTDFTAQLAQFSSLEQQITSNDNLKAILGELQSSSEERNLFDYIGKHITSDGNPVAVKDGSVVSGGFYEIEEPATLDIVVYNHEGAAIRMMSSGTEMIAPGTYNISWDGRDESGYMVPNGEYTYKVIGKDPDGEYISVSTQSSNLVTGISSVGGKPYLAVGSGLVDPATVENISMIESMSVVD